MARTNAIRAVRLALAQRSAVNVSATRQTSRAVTNAVVRSAGSQSTRAFTNSSFNFKGLMPETADPAPRTVEPENTASAPTEITTEEFHEAADVYIDQLVATLEELQEAREDVDVEYSVSPCGRASRFIFTFQVLTDHNRPVSSPSRSHQLAPMSSTSSHQTSRSGSARQSPDQSALTGLCLERRRTRRRVVVRASGSISVMDRRSLSSLRASSAST